MKALVIEKRRPSVSEYQLLRNSTGWLNLDDETVDTALENAIFSVCIIKNEKVIGIGRIVGDGAAYFYIQDVIVLPEFQNQGIGSLIMKELENFLSENAPRNAFIGLMAAEGKEGFYKNFNYKVRPSTRPGMYKITT